MDYFDKVKAVINNYSFIGQQVLADGTILVGKAPHIAPLAWLHNIYPVLSKEEIYLIEYKTGVEVPDAYAHFLTHHSNGLMFFVATLSLHGLRKRMGRSIEDAWQPFSIDTRNTFERVDDASPFHFFIGSYNWDGSLLYIDNKTGKVHRCSRKTVKPLNTWDSFEEMIVTETERIALLFDERGVKKNEKAATMPPRKK